jgi:hypothetical protein
MASLAERGDQHGGEIAPGGPSLARDLVIIDGGRAGSIGSSEPRSESKDRV